MSIEFWLRFELQTRPTRLAINFLLITARVERKVPSCVKLFDFFRGSTLIRLTWNLSRFVPNSVEILTWNFRKTYFRRIFQKFSLKPRLSSTKTREISPCSLQFLFCIRIALKKFTQVLSCVFCTQVRRHVHKRIKKRRYGEEKPGRFVFGKPVLFALGLGLTTPYSLRDLVWNFYQMFVTVSIEFWLRFELQIRSTRLGINFLLIIARAERKVRSCVKLFDFSVGQHSSVWPEICRVLSRIQWRFLRGISGKNYFGRIFQKFSLKPRLSSTKTREILLYSLQFLFYIRIALKKFTQVFSCVVCTQLRRHVHNKSQKEDTGKKSQDVLFSENQFCSLSVRDLLRLTLWVFWSAIFTRRSSLCLLSFGWHLSPRFVPQDWQ